MRMKPHINAVDMKSVFATGQNPTRLGLFELGKTDGALDRIFMCRGGESENGERFYDGGVETACGDYGGRVGGEEHHCSAAVTAA